MRKRPPRLREPGGAWSLYVLHELLGELERAVDFEDLRRVAEEISGHDLERYFDEWFHGAESSRLLADELPIAEIVQRYRAEPDR